MSAPNGGGASAAPDGDYSWLPSRDQLVGAWAKGVLQLWDLALAWWKVIPEQAEAEDPTLGAWSTSVFYPRRTDRPTKLGWSGLRTDRGEVVPTAAVQVEPTTVDAGDGTARLRIAVGRPTQQDAFHYRLTVYDVDEPDDASFRREYGLGFGVPGAAV